MNSPIKLNGWEILLGACLMTACTARPPSDLGDNPPEIQLEGVGVKYFRGNELRAVVRAQQATLRRGSGDLTAQSARLRFLAQSDRPEIEVAAREAQGNLNSQQVVARGGVRIAEAGGAAGVTEAAALDAKAHRVSGDQPVDLVGAGYRIRSQKGFVLDFSAPGALALEGPIDTTVGGLP